jgi:hypothetical protein
MKIIDHFKSDWFRYGFETIAVVVGILVAFALDNWNEDRKQEILEIQYLQGLKADLASDTAYYNRRIGDSEGAIKDNSMHIQKMYETQLSLEEARDLLSHASWNSEHLTTQNSTYIDLTNSGSLSMISNQVLKEMVIDYYRENEIAATHIMEFNEVSSRSLVEIGNVIRNYSKFMHFNDDLYGDESKFTEGEWAFINDPTSEKFQTLEYALTIYRLKHREFLDHFNTLKFLSTKLIKEIHKELDSRT